MKANGSNGHNCSGRASPLQDRQGNSRGRFGNGSADGPVQVEFIGYTHGLLTPEVRVFRGGSELSWSGFGAIVTSSPVVSREMRFRDGGIYCAEPLLRDLKKYLTAEVFLPRHYTGRFSAFLYLDRQGHPHVRFVYYDFVLLAGLAAFLQVCRELEEGKKEPQLILASLRQCPEAPVYSPTQSTITKCVLLVASGVTAWSSVALITRTPRPFICSKNVRLFTARRNITTSSGLMSVPVAIMSTVTTMRGL